MNFKDFIPSLTSRNRFKFLLLASILLFVSNLHSSDNYFPGSYVTDAYFNSIKNKRIGLVVNQTSTIGSVHLVDSLVHKGFKIVKIFAPEHGYRGNADAGEHIENGKDIQTGIDIFSLYGSKKKPGAEDLAGIDIMVFDIQDVGVRFYTYISTLHYIMEACAENKVPLIVLDRPNPNGFYIDGPIIEKKYRSFIGMHPVPIVYGMTIGEYGKMINGEKWLENGIQCKLTVIPCKNYIHADRQITLPIKPSPNLPNARSIYLYPSLCLFEGTKISLGRGTDYPFQLFGHPKLKAVDSFSFTPVSKPGAKNPPLINELCYGAFLAKDASIFSSKESFNLKYMQYAYENISDTSDFFLSNGFFEKLTGTASMRRQIIEKKSIESIKMTWKKGLDAFRKVREKYLLYK